MGFGQQTRISVLLVFLIAVKLFDAQYAPVITDLIRYPPMGFYAVNTANSLINLTCIATGSAPLRYSWRLNGTVINEDQSTLVIKAATNQNAGIYECLASNYWGTAVSQNVRMTAAYINSFPGTATPPTLSVEERASMKMTCQEPPTSEPQALYSWGHFRSSNGQEAADYGVTTGDRVQVDQSTGDLHIANVVAFDYDASAPFYGCVATVDVPGQRSSVNGSFYSLVVSDTAANPLRPRPAFKNPKSDNPTIFSGEQATFECFFYGYPTPTITWYRDRDNNRETIGNGSIFTIDKVNASDGNGNVVYTCIGINSGGSAQFAFTPTVEVRPVFNPSDPAPRDTNSTLGDTVSFECRPAASQNYIVSWYINGTILNENALPPRYSLYGSRRNLTINSVEYSDRGTVTCKVLNDDGSALANGYLYILEPTAIGIPPQNQSTPKGKSATFVCSATSDPLTEIHYSWLFNGTEIVYKNKEIYNECNQTSCKLTIARVKDENGGTYECRAHNSYSEAVSESAHLEILPAPFSVADIWWVFLIVGLFVLLIIVLIICYCYFKDNDGDAYPVDELENKNGNNPSKELHDKGFQAFEPPPIDQVWSTGGLSNSYHTNGSKMAPYSAVSTPYQTITKSSQAPVQNAAYSLSRADTKDSSSTLSRLDPSNLAGTSRPRTAINTLDYTEYPDIPTPTPFQQQLQSRMMTSPVNTGRLPATFSTFNQPVADDRGLFHDDDFEDEDYEGRTRDAWIPEPYQASPPLATGYDVGRLMNPYAASSDRGADNFAAAAMYGDGDEGLDGDPRMVTRRPYQSGSDERRGESSV